ncbi:ammonium transporter [Pisolithus croceorrhizus]|nr:ammonium transporter [Pisolithus croceorrhizus]
MKFGDFFATSSLLKSTFDRGDVSFIIVAGAMVSFMIPGLAFLYSGLSRRKSALSLIWAVSASNAVCIFQWYLWGYSLAFSPTASNGFIGNLANFGLLNMEFACVGGIAERGRVLPAMIFTFLWMTLVYCPLACWAWNVNGWGYKWGVLDYAGGGPVEIGSGVAGLAYAWVLGRRQEKELLNFRPHNVAMVNLGTFILWFGWLGFNGGSAFGANLRAIMAIWNSMLAPAFGGIVWCLLDYRLERKYSMVGFCSGSIAGLVRRHPGFLATYTRAVCNYATKDLFAEHAVGGIIGLLFNGFFASHSIIALRRQGESAGLDEVEIGEFANDYIEVRRHFTDWSAFGDRMADSVASEMGGLPDLQKDGHRLRLEDPTLEIIQEKNAEIVEEPQPTPEER